MLFTIAIVILGGALITALYYMLSANSHLYSNLRVWKKFVRFGGVCVGVIIVAITAAAGELIITTVTIIAVLWLWHHYKRL